MIAFVLTFFVVFRFLVCFCFVFFYVKHHCEDIHVHSYNILSVLTLQFLREWKLRELFDAGIV